MKFNEKIILSNENIYKLNNMCTFNNLKLELKNDVILVLLCYDSLNLYLHNNNLNYRILSCFEEAIL